REDEPRDPGDPRRPDQGAWARVKASRSSLLLVAVLFAQLICRYLGVQYVAGVTFDWVTFATRLGALVLGVWALSIPWHELGFRLPRGGLKAWGAAAGILAAAAIAIFATRGSTSVLAYYSNHPSGSQGAFLQGWILFVLSTTIAWELLHRGLLLFGLRYLLSSERGAAQASFDSFACAVVCVFETLFHVVKPAPEALGMMVFSPALSLLALRTGSIVLPAIVHTVLEGIFYWFTLSAL